MENQLYVTVSIIIAIISFIAILIVGFKTDILKGTSTDKNDELKYSFSKFQLWLWSLVICPAFSLYWGFHGKVYINETSLILLGISAGLPLTSKMISDAQGKQISALPFGNFWTDILKDDLGHFSIGRLQNLIFTFIYVVIFVTYLFKNTMDYPEFENSAYILMGISSGAYLFGKALKR